MKYRKKLKAALLAYGDIIGSPKAVGDCTLVALVHCKKVKTRAPDCSNCHAPIGKNCYAAIAMKCRLVAGKVSGEIYPTRVACRDCWLENKLRDMYIPLNADVLTRYPCKADNPCNAIHMTRQIGKSK